MTPMWREQIKLAMAGTRASDRMRLELFAKARCFDLSEVQAPLAAAAQEMGAAALREVVSDGAGVQFVIDIGERTVLPAEVSWLEWGNCAVLIDGTYAACEALGVAHPTGGGDGGIAFGWLRWSDGVTRPSDLPGVRNTMMEGALGSFGLRDGYAHLGRFCGDAQPDEIEHSDPGSSLLFLALAGLSLINSPAASSQQALGHRGLQRNVRRSAGREPALTFTKVTLVSAEAVGTRAASAAPHPKAYHFCRAHVRQRANGRIERVRAHWRGDPAFGYRLPTYRVAA